MRSMNFVWADRTNHDRQYGVLTVQLSPRHFHADTSRDQSNHNLLYIYLGPQAILLQDHIHGTFYKGAHFIEVLIKVILFKDYLPC